MTDGSGASEEYRAKCRWLAYLAGYTPDWGWRQLGDNHYKAACEGYVEYDWKRTVDGASIAVYGVDLAIGGYALLTSYSIPVVGTIALWGTGVVFFIWDLGRWVGWW